MAAVETDEEKLDTKQTSALTQTGAIPRLRASAMVLHAGKMLTVRLRDPVTQTVESYLPGGKIENNESPEAAAERECLEETGYAVQVITGNATVARYPFVYSGKLYDCTTHFFMARLVDPDRTPAVVNDADYNLGCEWIDANDEAAINQAFGFHETIHACVKTLLKHVPQG